MPSPFPGMDPYLESPAFWYDFYASFIVYCADALLDQLPDGYEARIQEQINDAEGICERWINILQRPERTLVTVLELLSLSNKYEPGFGDYLSKRTGLLHRHVHLIELDFLVGGHRIPLRRPLPPGDYYALIARADRRPDCEVHAWTVRHPLPTIPVPLKAPDPDVKLNLGAVFTYAYDRGRYARSIDYGVPPTAPLGRDDLGWAVEPAKAFKP